MRSIRVSVATLVLVLAGAPALAQVQINEALINSPGTDNGLEFIELRGPASFDMSNLTLLVLEGEASGAGNGTIDQVLGLGGFSTGANGLFLWRDAAAVLNPPPHPQTTVRVTDFSPDIENGGNTYLLVSGFSGSLGTDLDANDDGVLDSTPWASVMDAFAYADSADPPGYDFVTGFGGFFIPQQTFTPDAFDRIGSTFAAFDVTGTNPGPWANDPTRTFGGPLPPEFTLTPGSENIPEPAALLLLLAGALVGRRR